MNFKVGDRVVYTGKRACYSKELLGVHGTVLEATDEDDIRVEWDGYSSSGVYSGNIKLVEQSPMEIVNKYKETEPDREDPFRHQVGGGHYKTMKIQPVEFILANGLGFCEGNAIKYLCRYKQKNGIQDLRKAKHYVEMLIELCEKEEKQNNAQIK